MPRMHGLPDDPVLLVIDSTDALRGLAKLSFIGPRKKSSRFNIARKRGFDGYVLDAAPGEQLSICVVGADARCVGRIPLSIPSSPP